MKHTGCNVYFWGEREQDRLLVECLGPAAEELRGQGLADRFWYDRFDARGPHVFALFSGPDEAAPETGRRLAARLDAYLAERPSAVVLEEELAARHAETRGKELCSADALPGLAGNNSYVLFEQPANGYPFAFAAGLENADEIWCLLDDLARAAVRQVASQPGTVPTGAAVRWIAGLDRELHRAGLAGEYWRYHMTTLLLGMEERLATSEEEVLDSVPRSLGNRNWEAFSRIWAEAPDRPLPWPHLPRLVDLALAESGRPLRRRIALLREAVHCFLKQLGLPVSRHIPLVLFAWHRAARPLEAVPA
jgi:hypothetical protein